MSSSRPAPWIFSARLDLVAFALPAAIALGLVLAAPSLGLPNESPTWVWVVSVLLIDVAHVWSTAFVTYLDPVELGRHPIRYGLVPGAGWVLGVVLYTLGGPQLFWRCLAYLAVFHFVRQQYGWVALYRARMGDRSGAWIDGAAIYAATLYPLLWWHAHLPRRFDWFMAGDFLPGLPDDSLGLAFALYTGVGMAYGARAVCQRWRGQPMPWGKHVLVLTTAATWYLGIVATNSDLAFTVCNVLTHGVPYAVLVFVYGRHVSGAAHSPLPGSPAHGSSSHGSPSDASLAQYGRAAAREGVAARVLGGRPGRAALRFVACLWLLAFIEELLWDHAVWHEHGELFGRSQPLGFQALLVPLLAVPQWTHYVLDGLFWRKAHNPSLRGWFAASPIHAERVRSSGAG
jgi:hypothetical protein